MVHRNFATRRAGRRRSLHSATSPRARVLLYFTVDPLYTHSFQVYIQLPPRSRHLPHRCLALGQVPLSPSPRSRLHVSALHARGGAGRPVYVCHMCGPHLTLLTRPVRPVIDLISIYPVMTVSGGRPGIQGLAAQGIRAVPSRRSAEGPNGCMRGVVAASQGSPEAASAAWMTLVCLDGAGRASSGLDARVSRPPV